jgi:hypothetical protein
MGGTGFRAKFMPATLTLRLCFIGSNGIAGRLDLVGTPG